MQVVFNDRLDVPNTDATHQVLESPVRAVATELLGSGPYTLIREPDPARRYGMTIHSDTADSLDQMAAGLQTPTS